MQKTSYHIIGVMSGTSLDGIDIAEIIFELSNGHWDFKIINAETIPYSNAWKNRLYEGIRLKNNDLKILDEDYTLLLGTEISGFINKYSIKDLDAVSSHGHTILHRPHEGVTLQIGNLPQLAQIVNYKVVCDFRVADVQLGGQGAPLVPIGDRLLFSDFDLCMNLGGFSNVSFERNGTRIAFDICAVNTVLNFYANKLGLEYDDQGAIARSAVVNQELLENLNALDFYRLPFPKSLGLEFVRAEILPLMETFEISIEDKLATFTEHAAIEIANALQNNSGKMLVTGGGTFNTFLIERIKCHLPAINISIPDRKTINYKEALIFGFLGVLKFRNEVNVLCSVTGSKHDHSSGKIWDYPQK